MKKEYDFSQGERGKFYKPDLEINLPIYLEQDILSFVRKIAEKKNSESILSAFLSVLLILFFGHAAFAAVTTPNAVEISAGIAHNAAVMNDGTLWTWGANWYGQLGDGTRINKSEPVQIGKDTDWLTVDAGYSHNAAIKTDATLWTWGANWYGQLGDGTRTNRLTPKQIGTDADWLNVSANEEYTAAIKTNGTLWLWGTHQYSQYYSQYLEPTQIGFDTNWMSVSAGNSHIAAIKADGMLWAWGDNSHGQLGDGTLTNSDGPIQIGLGANWMSVSAGDSHTAAIKADGTLWAWGFNMYGQLGNETWTDSLTPVRIGIDADWLSVTAAGYHNFGLKTDGTLWAWGRNQYGQLGDETRLNRNKPIQIGSNITTVDMQTSAGVILPQSVINWAGVGAGNAHAAAIKTNGTIWTWGANDSGQLGDGMGKDSRIPVKIGTDWLTIDAGSYHTAGVKTDNSLWAWGANWYGELGDGTKINRYSPVQIGADWLSVAAGSYHTLGIKTDNSLLAWGANGDGRLGDNTMDETSTPVLIGTDWAAVSAGEGHSAGIKTDGSLWSWGLNWYGQLGDGTAVGKYTPTQIGTGWASLSAGSNHTMAIKTDGTLWAWGANWYNQLGDGTTDIRYLPTQIGSDTNWLSVSAGSSHTVAIKTDPTLWAWGSNMYGQLGNNKIDFSATPIQIGTGWLAVSAGLSHTVGIKTDGTLWAWGANEYGQLGDGTTNAIYNNSQHANPGWGNAAAVYNSNPLPTQIGTDTDWLSVSAGDYHTAALKTDHTAWLWGSNMYGQLGNATIWQGAPKQITSTPCEFSPCIYSSTNRLYFTTYDTQTINIKSSDGSGFTPSISASEPWLIVPDMLIMVLLPEWNFIITVDMQTPAGIILPQFVIKADTTGMTSGIYSAVIDISAPDLGTLQIPVVLEISDADITPPTITASFSPPQNEKGWNYTNVTVTFTCSDAESGVASCTEPITISTEGENQPVLAVSTDNAGNSISSTVLVNIDKTSPVITVPSDVLVNSSRPEIVNYQVSVDDNLTAAPTIKCTPASGSKFPFGTTTVICRATDDADNRSISTTTVTVKPILPDLVITDISGPADGTIGGRIIIPNRVLNQGSANISGNFNVVLYFSRNNQITASDISLKSRPVTGGLAAGEDSSHNTSIIIPEWVLPGKYYIGAIADPNNQVYEGNNKNNSLAGNTIVVISGADLVMSAVSGPAKAAAGSHINIANTITNSGISKSYGGSLNIGIYLSDDNQITTSDTRIGSRLVNSGLPAGRSNTRGTVVTIPASLPPGTYYIGAIADPNRHIAESNNNNNSLAGNVIVITK